MTEIPWIAAPSSGKPRRLILYLPSERGQRRKQEDWSACKQPSKDAYQVRNAG